MDNYYNMSLYGSTQDDITSSQCSAQDFMLTQNSYDLSRYAKDNQINNNSNALEIIKEEDIFSQAEQLFYENEKASLQKATFIEQNLANNANNKANLNKGASNNNSNNNLNTISFANDNCAKINNYAPNKPSANNSNAGNSNVNNANNKSANNAGNFKANNNCSSAASNNSLIDEKIFLISQEIDKIEMKHKEDSLKKLNQPVNNNGNGKNQNNFTINKNHTNNSNTYNNSTNGIANINTNKIHNTLNQNSNIPANNNNLKANKLKNDLLQSDPSLNLKAKADFNTEKKQSVQKNDFYEDSFNLNISASHGVSEELNQELLIKIKSVTDNFLNEFDTFSSKINNALDNYKRVFLSDVNVLYRILKDETVYFVSEEEKSRIIDEKIKIIFNEMMGVFSQISPKGI